MFCEYHTIVTRIRACNTRAIQASNHRVFGDIGNLNGAMSVHYNVNKDGFLE